MAMTAPVPGFDTLSYARRLKEAGVDEAQAETHAEAVRDAIMEGAATKADIAAVRTDIARLETRMTVRFYGMAAGIVALTVALLLVVCNTKQAIQNGNATLIVYKRSSSIPTYTFVL